MAEPGRAGVFFFQPNGTIDSDDIGPIQDVFAYEIHRYINKIGTWRIAIPVDQQLVEETGGFKIPLQTRVKRGWRVTIVQENQPPPGDGDALLTKGMVIDARFESTDAGTHLMIDGLFGEMDLASLSTRKGLEYAASAAQTILEDLIQVTGVLNQAAIIPATAGARVLTIAFDRISRYEAFLQVCDAVRFNLREAWDNDNLELVSQDNLPVSGITLVSSQFLDTAAIIGQGTAGASDSAAAAGIGIIAGSIGISEEGNRIANRVIPTGADTDEKTDGETIRVLSSIGGGGGRSVSTGFLSGGPVAGTEQTSVEELTLENAATSPPGPFTVLSDLNPDGSTRWYIEDSTSIGLYGLVELDLNRADIRNPTDDPLTRTSASRALYVAAAGELVRRRARVTWITVSLVNGDDIWMLPGDRVLVQYSGWTVTSFGEVLWKDIDDYFMVMERTDTSRPGGTREVQFLLGKPEFREQLPDIAGVPQVQIGLGTIHGLQGPMACLPGPRVGTPTYNFPASYNGPPQPLEVQPPLPLMTIDYSGSPNSCGSDEAGVGGAAANDCCGEGTEIESNDTELPNQPD